ncbi:tRNA-splicing ligase RtcB [Pseudomonas benzenivorans]|nr:RtcB family protein [Pseudomonas benzenivorans]SDG59178.1 tRNA-splicing ligase RtcB [Pseudomonas benzenivorans]
MDLGKLEALSEHSWRIPAHGSMRVPGVIFASRGLLEAMDDKVYQQTCNVATLPGIVDAAYAMPDAHWGYGFPIGGVAAFDAEAGGVVSAGGVGFDISCGVRLLHTGLAEDDIRGAQRALADALFRDIPAGVGSHGALRLGAAAMEAMLRGGARWAVEQGFGSPEDLELIEEQGCMADAEPAQVSPEAKRRQRDEMGTLGSGNHYLEVQRVVRIYDERLAQAFGIRQGDIKISIHCGSRGLGHQIGTEFLRRMAVAANGFGIALPDRELACAPIASALGQQYLGAMRAACNCALANRQIITSLARETFARLLPRARLSLLFDVSHNTCKRETHRVDGRPRELYVHRKGATRAFGAGHPSLPPAYRAAGQPVLIGGTMGTASYVLAGTEAGMTLAFGSACHGAGRAMSRHQATRLWNGERLRDELAARGVLIRSPSWRGVAEEAPGAYKDVDAVAQVAELSGLARRVARLEPLVCIKG